MPTAARPRCSTPRCPGRAHRGGRCEKCIGEYEQGRGSARERGYDSDWEQLRDAFLEVNPFCSDPDCNEMATDVDHKLSVQAFPQLRLEWSNLDAKCHKHHSRKTVAEDGGFGRPKVSR